MKELTIDRDLYWRLLAVFTVFSLLLVMTDTAFAAGTSDDVIGATLCRVTQQLQGNIAKSIATIAIFSVGIGLFMGKMNWGTGAMIAAGVAIMFGAGKMVSWVGGTAASECTT